MSIDLDEMKKVYSAKGPSVPDPVGLDAMIRQTKKRFLRTWFHIAVELIMVFTLLALLAYMTLSSPSLLASSVFISLAIILLAIETWLLKQRARLWHSPALSSREHADFQIRQAQLNLKFARFGFIGSPIGLIMGYIAMALYNDALLFDLSKSILTTAAMAMLLAFFHYWVRKRKAELCKTISVSKELARYDRA